MADYDIKKGYTVPIKGDAALESASLPHPPFIGVCPIEFAGLKPKLSVKVNDEVKVGSPLFFHKKKPELQFLSPAAGRVTAINYGPRRVIEEIIIATNKTYEYESFPKKDLGAITKMNRDQMVEALMKGGVWPYIRQRPYNRIADHTATPKAIFVNCMDTAPLAADPNFALKDKGKEFKAGVAALKRMCDTVHVVTRKNNPADAFNVDNANTHRFSGKHPAGLVGTHITHISPINKGEVVWTVNARDAVMIGHLMLTGQYPTERIVAVAGPGATKAQYFTAQTGIKIKDVLKGNVASGEQRIVSGNVLTGTTKSEDGFLGFYDDLITVLPEGREQHFLGWLAPGGDRPSFTRAYISGLMGGKRFDMHTNMHGGHRAIIQSGQWEKVVALDIHPEFLVKASIAKDIEAMEKLGILECDAEDFALCTYVCPSKTEVSTIIADALELMEKEG